MLSGVAPIVARSLERFREALHAQFGDRLRELTLFGSQARGEAHEESDVDVLVVVDDLTESERKRIYDFSYDAGIEGDELVSLSPLAYATDHIADMRAREKRLVREIARDGVPL
jgi:predicted nucleotidyltransferase